MDRLMLEGVASGLVRSKQDVALFINFTLFAFQAPWRVVKEATIKALRFLDSSDIIDYNHVTQTWSPSKLGVAAFRSSLTAKEALLVYVHLREAQKEIILEGDLHSLFLVAPLYLNKEPDWSLFCSTYEQLDEAEKRIFTLVSLPENLLYQSYTGKPPKRGTRAYEDVRRMWLALILRELVQDTPVSAVANKYHISRGELQELQEQAYRFSCLVTSFCQRLNWWDLELICSAMTDRLSVDVPPALLPLLAIPGLNLPTARKLYGCGVKTVQHAASVSEVELAHMLSVFRAYDSSSSSSCSSSSSSSFSSSSSAAATDAKLVQMIRRGAQWRLSKQLEEKRVQISRAKTLLAKLAAGDGGRDAEEGGKQTIQAARKSTYDQKNGNTTMTHANKYRSSRTYSGVKMYGGFEGNPGPRAVPPQQIPYFQTTGSSLTTAVQPSLPLLAGSKTTGFPPVGLTMPSPPPVMFETPLTISRKKLKNRTHEQRSSSSTPSLQAGPSLVSFSSAATSSSSSLILPERSPVLLLPPPPSSAVQATYQPQHPAQKNQSQLKGDEEEERETEQPLSQWLPLSASSVFNPLVPTPLFPPSSLPERPLVSTPRLAALAAAVGGSFPLLSSQVYTHPPDLPPASHSAPTAGAVASSTTTSSLSDSCSQSLALSLSLSLGHPWISPSPCFNPPSSSPPVVDVLLDVQVFHEFTRQWALQPRFSFAVWGLLLPTAPLHDDDDDDEEKSGEHDVAGEGERREGAGFAGEDGSDGDLVICTELSPGCLLHPSLSARNITGLAVCWSAQSTFVIDFSQLPPCPPPVSSPSHSSSPPLLAYDPLAAAFLPSSANVAALSPALLHLGSVWAAVNTVMTNPHTLKISFDVKSQLQILRMAGLRTIPGPLAEPRLAHWLLYPEEKRSLSVYDLHLHYVTKKQSVADHLQQQRNTGQRQQRSFRSNQNSNNDPSSSDLVEDGHENKTNKSTISDEPMADDSPTIAVNGISCALDVWQTWLLMKHLFPLLQEHGLLQPFVHYEMPLKRVLADMTFSGIGFDPAVCRSMAREACFKAHDLQRQANLLVGKATAASSSLSSSSSSVAVSSIAARSNNSNSNSNWPLSFHIASTRDVARALFGPPLSLPFPLPIKPSMRGKLASADFSRYSTNASVLNALIDLKLSPLPAIIKEYRSLSYILSSQLLPLPRYARYSACISRVPAEAVSAGDLVASYSMYRIHPHLSQTQSATGRLVYHKPNLHSISNGLHINPVKRLSVYEEESAGLLTPSLVAACQSTMTPAWNSPECTYEDANALFFSDEDNAIPNSFFLSPLTPPPMNNDHETNQAYRKGWQTNSRLAVAVDTASLIGTGGISINVNGVAGRNAESGDGKGDGKGKGEKEGDRMSMQVLVANANNGPFAMGKLLELTEKCLNDPFADGEGGENDSKAMSLAEYWMHKGFVYSAEDRINIRQVTVRLSLPRLNNPVFAFPADKVWRLQAISNEANVLNKNLAGKMKGGVSSSNAAAEDAVTPPSELETAFEVRQAFIPSPGYILLSADYAQVELRLMAHFSQDPLLTSIFQAEQHVDIMCLFAAELFLSPPPPATTTAAATTATTATTVTPNICNNSYSFNMSEVRHVMSEEETLRIHQANAVTDAQRAQAKQVVYSMVYGCSVPALAREMRVTASLAERYARDFDLRFPRLQLWKAEEIARCKCRGWIESLQGRKRFLGNMAGGGGGRGRGGDQRDKRIERQIINTLCQSSAADLIKEAMLVIHDQLLALESNIATEKEVDEEKEGCRRGTKEARAGCSLVPARIVLQMHDEVLLEVREDCLQRVALLVQQAMTSCIQLTIPLRVVLKTGYSWGQMLRLNLTPSSLQSLS